MHPLLRGLYWVQSMNKIHKFSTKSRVQGMLHALIPPTFYKIHEAHIVLCLQGMLHAIPNLSTTAAERPLAAIAQYIEVGK